MPIMSFRTLSCLNNSTRAITCRRLFHASRTVLKDPKFPNDTLEQGHASKKTSGVKDTQAESARSGLERKQGADKGGLDAASGTAQAKARSSPNGGNPEQIGFAEQVGGATYSSNKFDNGEKQGGGASRSEGRTAQDDEEAQAPGLLSSLKQAIGLNTTSGDVKQNRGGGSGVTGTGTFGDSGRKQGLHTSATAAIQPTYHRIVEKDAPNPADYMKNVAQGLAEPCLSSNRQHQRNHNLSHRHRELSKDLGQNGEAWEREEASESVTVSTPKILPGGHAPKSNDHASGEWSSAGLGDKQYRNVGVEEEPYELPADDEDSHSKLDARQKKLRYGGLAKNPELV